MSNKYKISTARLAEIIREEYASIIQEVHGKELAEKKKKKFPDLTGDGEVTQADILKARGVDLNKGKDKGDDSDDDKEAETKSDKKKEAKKESVQSLKDLIQQEIAKL